MRVDGFDWDAGNQEKCAKHGLTIDKIEALFRRPVMVFPDEAHSMSEPRLRAVGRTDEGRAVFVVFTVRVRAGARLIRPISARYMHRKEIARFEEENSDL
ncbi:MAG: BrnT family toxin [Alphaproteobacteria bacterium]